MLLGKSWITAFAVVLSFVIGVCGTEVLIDTFCPQFAKLIWIRVAGGIAALAGVGWIFHRLDRSSTEGTSVQREDAGRWFTRRQRPMPTIESPFGVFSFDGTGWMTHPAANELVFVSIGRELNTEMFAQTQVLLRDLEVYRQQALDYAQTNGADVWHAADGDLQLEEVEITDILQNGWGLTFGVAGQPDFTVTVEFRGDKPVEIWGAG